MKGTVLIFAAALLWVQPIVSRAATMSTQETFNEGNRLYEQGDWDGALGKYMSLDQQGFQSAELYYNLGNTYHRLGERGRAVLWFERASRLQPRDSDVDFNLGLTRSHLKDEGPSFFERLFTYFSERELAGTFTAFTFVFFGTLGWRLLRRSESEWGAAALWTSGMFWVISAVWLSVNIAWNNRPVAVVTKPPAEVRNGPGESYPVGFTLPEGSKVLVLNRRPEWSQVGVTQQGLKGWLPTREIELINPKENL